MQDIQELKSSMLMASDFFKKRSNTLVKAEEIAEAIILKTINYINVGDINSSDFVFNYQDIYEMVWRKAESADKASKTVRAHLDKLKAIFALDSDLNQELIAKGQLPLELKVHASEGGRRTLVEVITVSESTRSQTHKMIHEIRYYATMLPKPFFWTKPFIVIALNPTRLGLFALAIILCGLYGVATLTKLTSSGSNLIDGISILATIALIYLYHKLSELLNKGVTPVPNLMISIRQSNAFFVLQRDEKTISSVNGLKSIAVVYEAKCGICGEKIIIEKSREFNGRYLGKCVISPYEHVFSFDHVSKYGKFLR